MASPADESARRSDHEGALVVEGDATMLGDAILCMFLLKTHPARRDGGSITLCNCSSPAYFPLRLCYAMVERVVYTVLPFV